MRQNVWMAHFIYNCFGFLQGIVILKYKKLKQKKYSSIYLINILENPSDLTFIPELYLKKYFNGITSV